MYDNKYFYCWSTLHKATYIQKNVFKMFIYGPIFKIESSEECWDIA